MTSIVYFKYGKNELSNIQQWAFGKNWPVAYIIYNDKKAYVGETLDAVRRTEQHIQDKGFNCFTNICLISGRSYNKSVIIDLESFLIKYLSADGKRTLTNGNAGIVDHNYFYKESYFDDFKEIWKELQKEGICQKSLVDIENSNFFKYSPYKTLNVEQQNATYEILKMICEINNNITNKSLIMITGGAGTGKTIVAVYLMKLLVDYNSDNSVLNRTENSEEILQLKSIFDNSRDKLGRIRCFGLVEPMKEIRLAMKEVFKSVEGLSADMVLAPEDVIKKRYDLLIVDEAHRLYKRKVLSGARVYGIFDDINKVLMPEGITKTENDKTELDWIICSSSIQVLFYDKNQAIRSPDIDEVRFQKICKPLLYKTIELSSQMRCKGGNGYYDYLRTIFDANDLNYKKYKKIQNYDIKVFDKVEDLLYAIKYQYDQMNGLCEVVAGPAWGKNEKVEIDGCVFSWKSGKKTKDSKVISSIHNTQGFDLNYAGVIVSDELYYDCTEKCIAVNIKKIKDPIVTNKSSQEEIIQRIKNTYITLMTRGIHGTYLYVADSNLKQYFKQFFSSN